MAIPVYRLLFLVIASSLSTVIAHEDFERCKNHFLIDNAFAAGHIYQGRLYGGYNPPPEIRRSIISLKGCEFLCKSGIEYYHWKNVAKTITTWVLPTLGLLLQAPYESNQFRNTLLSIARWLGSPIASLSYTLWNIKIAGKCALVSDMSSSYKVFPKRGDPQADLRNSLYILSVMNQYTVKPLVDGKKSLQLLRIALFADEIPTTPPILMNRRRSKMAALLREGRKRGVVPVFISIMWFIFALGISIQDAFGDVGGNATAHNLAIGLLVAWFPVLILSSTVDRNPILTETTCHKLNELLIKVQEALQDEAVLIKFCETNGLPLEDYAWIVNESQRVPSHLRIFNSNNHAADMRKASIATTTSEILASGFFSDYAGQGRIRWHYGVAHPILIGIEYYVAPKDRQWLDELDARRALLLGDPDNNRVSEFDGREIWDFLIALFVITGTIAGAFVISFRTPTIGLGCRSGGYVIFGSLALGLFLLELLAWATVFKSSARRQLPIATALGIFFSIGEVFSTCWLFYIIGAQTLGGYNTCACMASVWGGGGGYIDFHIAEKAPGVEKYWILGTVLSSGIMFIAIALLTIQWCEQSHLNSEDFDKAMKGLRRTRQFKRHTRWLRWLPEFFLSRFKYVWHIVTGHADKRNRRSLVWSIF